ncbi:MAG: hypothetical protein JXA00_06075 [Candidatus Thermoplasmatota archaeon]|nr:hypothetical protein [Candidatus Thermoplasmatota archaeon]
MCENSTISPVPLRQLRRVISYESEDHHGCVTEHRYPSIGRGSKRCIEPGISCGDRGAWRTVLVFLSRIPRVVL